MSTNNNIIKDWGCISLSVPQYKGSIPASRTQVNRQDTRRNETSIERSLLVSKGIMMSGHQDSQQRPRTLLQDRTNSGQAGQGSSKADPSISKSGLSQLAALPRALQGESQELSGAQAGAAQQAAASLHRALDATVSDLKTHGKELSPILVKAVVPGSISSHSQRHLVTTHDDVAVFCNAQFWFSMTILFS